MYVPADIHIIFCVQMHYVMVCTVLYCTVLYCTVLYCTVLYCTVLYCTVLYCMRLHVYVRVDIHISRLCVYICIECVCRYSGETCCPYTDQLTNRYEHQYVPKWQFICICRDIQMHMCVEKCMHTYMYINAVTRSVRLCTTSHGFAILMRR